jgi:hypothetical protein
MVRADWAIVTGWQKLLLGFALCLPVPALSVSGLALPLPSAVYRLAVAIVESTESLAGALTGAGADQETRVLAVRPATTPRRPVSDPPSGSSPRLDRRSAPPRASVRVQPAVRRGFGTTPTTRNRATRPAADAVVRPASVPAEPQTKAAVPAAAAGSAAASPIADSPRVTKEQRSADTVPIQPLTSKPSVTPPPPPSPPPSPPPAPTPEPGLLEPVTKPLEPVTKPLEPVAKPLAPVTEVVEPITTPLKPVTGRLEILSP